MFGYKLMQPSLLFSHSESLEVQKSLKKTPKPQGDHAQSLPNNGS